MDKVTTADRLKQIMSEENLKQADILRRAEPYCKKYMIKLGRNDLSQYVSGKTMPRQNKLFVLAKALNVNEAWLMGYDVSRERKKNNTANTDDYIWLYNMLDSEDRAEIRGEIKQMLKNSKYDKSPKLSDDIATEISKTMSKTVISVK